MRQRGTRGWPILFCLMWWVIIAGIVGLIDPELIKDIPVPGSYGLFFGLLAIAVWFTGALIWKNYRRAVLTTGVILGFLILRLIKLGYWLNGLLILGIAIAIDSVFTKRKERDK